MLLSMSIFIYFGAVCPWQSFAPHIRTESLLDSPLPAWRLICLGISILALRGVPAVVALYLLGWLRPHVSSLREAGFIGFFGPIGVSAIFYLHVLLEYLRKDVVSKSGSEEPRADVRELFDVARVCIWFVVVCSVVCRTLFPRTPK
jgi:NhaP-type Na+/H+ or K+/H+ antiporter